LVMHVGAMHRWMKRECVIQEHRTAAGDREHALDARGCEPRGNALRSGHRRRAHDFFSRNSMILSAAKSSIGTLSPGYTPIQNVRCMMRSVLSSVPLMRCALP